MKCDICGNVDKLYTKTRDNKFGMILCIRHYTQLYKYGRVLERTRSDLNEIIIYKNHAEIVLYDKDNNEKARTLISLDKVELVKKYKWNINSHNEINARVDGKYIKLHRLIMNAEHGEFVDHINRNKLDNTNENLRFCTIAQNNCNKSITNNESKARGVVWDKARNKWRSQIGIDGKFIYLGRYDNLEDAVKVRKEAEEKYFGEFAPK